MIRSAKIKSILCSIQAIFYKRHFIQINAISFKSAYTSSFIHLTGRKSMKSILDLELTFIAFFPVISLML